MEVFFREITISSNFKQSKLFKLVNMSIYFSKVKIDSEKMLFVV